MNSGMGLLSSRHGHAPGVFAHTGTDEYRYLRGGAVELNFRPAKLTLFASLRELDGRLEGDSLKSINTSGYHRLLLDRKRKHNTQQQVAGGRVDFQFRQIHFGLSGLYIHIKKASPDDLTCLKSISCGLDVTTFLTLS